MKGKSRKQNARRCKKAATRVLHDAMMWCCSWRRRSLDEEARGIPKDVPKGHFVVYVGEEWKRHVIEIGVLKHPLFKMLLLDSAEEMFGFANANPKLYLPCKECVFVTTLQCIGNSYRNHRASHHLWEFSW